MSRKALVGLGTAIISILGITIGLGQGCAGGSSLPGFGGFRGTDPMSLNGALRGTSLSIGLSGLNNGNGGGYGGMVFNNEGQYGASSSQMASQESSEHHHHGGGYDITSGGYDTYLLVAANSACKTYPKGWEAVGPFVSALLQVNTRHGIALYDQSLCSGSSMIQLEDLSQADFDPAIIVYQDKVFQEYPTPPALGSLQQTVALCRSQITTEPQSGADLGTDVRIYQNHDGSLAGEIVAGEIVNAVPTRLAVRGFAVTQATGATGLKFTAQGFELDIPNPSTVPAAGSVTITLGGQNQTIQLPNCWR